MTRIRCKFRIDSVLKPAYGGEGVVVHANAVYDNSPENREFSKYTPWGTLHVGIDNPAVLPSFLEGGKLAAGREFYLDLVPVES
jgi:hypothetical protein